MHSHTCSRLEHVHVSFNFQLSSSLAGTNNTKHRVASSTERNFQLTTIAPTSSPIATTLAMASTEVRPTNIPTIKNAPLVGLAEGSGQFSNYILAGLVLGIPYFLKGWIPLVSRGGFYTYWTLVLLMGIPIAIGYWSVSSTYGKRMNEKVKLPGKDIEEYITIKDHIMKIYYGGKEKIPIQVFHDAYFEGKIDIKGTYFITFMLFRAYQFDIFR